MNDLLLSAFSLCASNGGLFKSEKQALFFADKHQGEIVSVETYTFGDHGGCRHRVTYSAKFDEQGFTRIAKDTAKGEVLLFERGGLNTYAENRAKKEAYKATARKEVLDSDIPALEQQIAGYQQQIADARTNLEKMEAEARALMPADLWQTVVSVNEKMVLGYEAAIEQAHVSIARLKKEFKID